MSSFAPSLISFFASQRLSGFIGELVRNSEFANLLFFVGDRALRSWERPPHRFAEAKRHPSKGGEWTFLRILGGKWTPTGLLGPSLQKKTKYSPPPEGWHPPKMDDGVVYQVKLRKEAA